VKSVTVYKMIYFLFSVTYVKSLQERYKSVTTKRVYYQIFKPSCDGCNGCNGVLNQFLKIWFSIRKWLTSPFLTKKRHLEHKTDGYKNKKPPRLNLEGFLVYIETRSCFNHNFHLNHYGNNLE